MLVSFIAAIPIAAALPTNLEFKNRVISEEIIKSQQRGKNSGRK
jgi:hypothetical protein